MLNKGISLVLPVYNEEENIAFVVDSALRFLPAVADDFEIIAVNDGSTDRTAEILAKLAVSYGNLKVIQHPYNRGYGAALRFGFKTASKEITLLMDADRQFDIAEIKKLLPFIEEYTIVAGFRLQRKDAAYRRALGAGFNFIMRIMFGINIKDINCGFKLYRADWLKNLSLTAEGALINVEIMYWANKHKLSVKQVGVSHFPRIYGRETGGSLRIILKAILETCRLKLKLWGLTSSDNVI